MIDVLFAGGAERWNDYEAPLRAAFAERGLNARLAMDIAPAEVEYIVYAPGAGPRDFTPFTRLKAVLNLWAGVEDVAPNETLSVPLCRMVDPSMTQGMVDYVAGHVLRYHLSLDRYILGLEREWDRSVPPVAQDRTILVLGLGALGSACASALAGLGFRVRGWSRRSREVAGVETFHGDEGFLEALAEAEIVILLLPLTRETENILDAKVIATLPRGAVLINPARGALVDDAALLAALDAGQIAHATCDVFREEPLPRDSPFWCHEKVTVTPHIASETRPATASRVIAENIWRGETGQPFLHEVDRRAGY